MLWQVDPRDSQPLYEQIAAVVRRGIGERTLQPGHRLPAAKDLAASLEVNLHTVLRAYQLLRDEGLIELRRGRGAIVIATELTASQLGARVDELIAHADRLGVSRDELLTLIQDRGQQ
ncbi:MAG: GntR family transcriptional regulator [Brooklawnia sp.]|jgi:GntR family transcriptional regulator